MASADVARPVFQRVLQNGLRVVVCPDPSGGDVSVLVRYNVGSRDEPRAADGLAHVAEHLMFSGTKHIPDGQIVERLVQAGATNVNGETTSEATTFHETLPPEELDLALWIESDRMGFLLDRLDADALARGARTVLNEYREHVVDAPFGDVDAMVRTALFPALHPYLQLPAGKAGAIAALTLVEARAFVSRWYVPSNATLAIAGRVDPDVALAAAERWFASLPAQKRPERAALLETTLRESTTLAVEANVTRAELRVLWLTPKLGAPGDADLDVAATVLANGRAGWLDRLVTEEPRLATQVGAIQRSFDGASIFEIRITLAPGHEPSEALSAVDESIARLGTTLSAPDMWRAQARWHNGYLFGLESSMSWAARLAAVSARGSLGATFDGGVSSHAAVTNDSVRSAVSSFLGRGKRVVVLGTIGRQAPVSGRLTRRSESSP